MKWDRHQTDEPAAVAAAAGAVNSAAVFNDHLHVAYKAVVPRVTARVWLRIFRRDIQLMRLSVDLCSRLPHGVLYIITNLLIACHPCVCMPATPCHCRFTIVVVFLRISICASYENVPGLMVNLDVVADRGDEKFGRRSTSWITTLFFLQVNVFWWRYTTFNHRRHVGLIVITQTELVTAVVVRLNALLIRLWQWVFRSIEISLCHP